jgi:oligopeptide/dipeptide ABC transporter ATP-binding protein
MSVEASAVAPSDTAPTAGADEILLDVDGLTVEFHTDEGRIRAVDGVSLQIPRGKTLGVVGESGCGKSVTAMSIMQLIPRPPGKFVAGSVTYEGRDLLKVSDQEMRKLRGNRISMIFQEPMTSLNPVFTVGDQIGEALRLHQGADKQEALDKAIEMLRLVGIPAPEDRVKVYPHQLSGGMRQRVMIAMALACKPDLLIADEPTTALDVTIQAQIMELMKKLQDELGMSIMLITHDLGVVAETCDVVQVMYAGVVVEKGSVEDIFHEPRHPYTMGLLSSVPGWTPPGVDEEVVHPTGPDGRPRLRTIKGIVPNLLELPKGCRFQSRCDRVQDACKEGEPPLEEVSPGHFARCFNLVPLSELLGKSDESAADDDGAKDESDAASETESSEETA